jgi:hypothetical protein
MDDMPQLKEFIAASEEIGEPPALEEIVTIVPPSWHNGEPHADSPVDESE